MVKKKISPWQRLFVETYSDSKGNLHWDYTYVLFLQKVATVITSTISIVSLGFFFFKGTYMSIIGSGANAFFAAICYTSYVRTKNKWMKECAEEI